MNYRYMWERLKEEIEMALDEGRDNGYADPSSEKFDKFQVYENVMRKITMIERYRHDYPDYKR